MQQLSDAIRQLANRYFLYMIRRALLDAQSGRASRAPDGNRENPFKRSL
jgi:hypothetical protein